VSTPNTAPGARAKVSTEATDKARELAEVASKTLRGEVDASALARGLYSSDASNYRVPPVLVAFPRDEHDLAQLGDLARRFEVPLTARGAGTSCAGNAVGPGIVAVTERHMDRILDIDVAGRRARVQPGVVLDTLQRALAPHGLRFGPDPSTHARCTFGGMIGNNACGSHAVAYGRTADNITALTMLDGRGRRIEARAGALAQVDGLEDLVSANLAVLRTEFGRFARQVSGYALEHLLPEKGSDLAKALVGSEGTLGLVTAATLRLVPLAAAPALVVLGYPTLPDADDAVPALLPFGPLAVEGMDARLVQAYERQVGGAPALPEGGAWLMVELAQASQATAVTRASGTRHVRVLPHGAQAQAMWRIRQDGAGFGGRTPHGHQGYLGFEDAAVPPDRLGTYLREFYQLLDDFGLEGIAYGHLGDGCVHIRIGFPFGAGPTGVRVFREFMAAAGRLVVDHGGSLSGEHGDGRARSELLNLMYSPAALRLMEQIKDLFDPLNLMNPGVVVKAAPLDADLRRPGAPPVKANGGFAFSADGGDVTAASHRCVGVAKCRTDLGPFMCPSFQATGEEKDSVRGRARILQEVANGKLIGPGFAATELAAVLDRCLGCKACSKDCPAGVDLAKLKSEALFRRYCGKPRPMVHYVLGALPRWLALAGRRPALFNALLHTPLLGQALMRAGGMDPRRRLPHLALEPFQAASSTGPAPLATDTDVVRGPRPVLLWADSFTGRLAPLIAQAVLDVLQDAGHTVYVVPPGTCCAVTWITTGQLRTAKRVLRSLLDVLGPFAVNGVPIVGIEPSCTAVLRSDLPDLLSADPRAPAVARAVKTLAEVLMEDVAAGWQPPDLTGVEVVAQPHCHHHAVLGWATDRALLTRLGAQVTELAGCCGMAGSFGMERGHYALSVKVAQRSLLPALAEAPDAVFLADGFSCRTQAADLAGRDGLHLAQLLAKAQPDAV
jgi:FAD/FMN-containing dehydrogenase/Fe-S oxidoreductase